MNNLRKYICTYWFFVHFQKFKLVIRVEIEQRLCESDEGQRSQHDRNTHRNRYLQLHWFTRWNGCQGSWSAWKIRRQNIFAKSSGLFERIEIGDENRRLWNNLCALETHQTMGCQYLSFETLQSGRCIFFRKLVNWVLSTLMFLGVH